MPASIRFLAINTVDPDQITPSCCALPGVEVESTIGDRQLVLFPGHATASRLALSASCSRRPPGTGCTSTRWRPRLTRSAAGG